MKKLFAALIGLVLLLWWIQRPAPAPPPAAANAAALAAEAPPVPAPADEARPLPPVVAESAPPPVSAPPAAEPAPRVHPQIRLADALLDAQTFYDREFGVMLVAPEGWTITGAARWDENNRKTTVRLRPPPGSRAQPSLYYQHYTAEHPAPTDPRAYLLEQAVAKEASRQGGGLTEYHNDEPSIIYREIDGRPSLSYFATYVVDDEVHAEYFMRVLGPEGYVMFFMKGPAPDVKEQIPAIFEMGRDIIPPGSPLPAISSPTAPPTGG